LTGLEDATAGSGVGQPSYDPRVHGDDLVEALRTAAAAALPSLPVVFESRVGRMADDVEVWAAKMDRELLTAIAEGRR
jgi:hypothetical protein